MARKPLIQPGSVLPPVGDSRDEGVLGRIIARDREKSGRGEAKESEEDSKNVTTLQRSTEVTRVVTQELPNAGTDVTTNEGSTSVGVPPVKEDVGTERAATSEKAEQASRKSAETEERMQTALARAEDDEVAVVTVRAPSSLNSYIDRYIERINRVHPKRKYRKQDAVAEMFAWFYAEHPMPPAPTEEEL